MKENEVTQNMFNIAQLAWNELSYVRQILLKDSFGLHETFLLCLHFRCFFIEGI